LSSPDTRAIVFDTGIVVIAIVFGVAVPILAAENDTMHLAAIKGVVTSVPHALEPVAAWSVGVAPFARLASFRTEVILTGKSDVAVRCLAAMAITSTKIDTPIIQTGERVSTRVV
jgi:hypothetical protein